MLLRCIVEVSMRHPDAGLQKVSINLDARSRELLDAATLRYGISRADLVRLAIRDTFTPHADGRGGVEQAMDRLRLKGSLDDA